MEMERQYRKISDEEREKEQESGVLRQMVDTYLIIGEQKSLTHAFLRFVRFLV